MYSESAFYSEGKCYSESKTMDEYGCTLVLKWIAFTEDIKCNGFKVYNSNKKSLRASYKVLF